MNLKKILKIQFLVPYKLISIILYLICDSVLVSAFGFYSLLYNNGRAGRIYRISIMSSYFLFGAEIQEKGAVCHIFL